MTEEVRPFGTAPYERPVAAQLWGFFAYCDAAPGLCGAGSGGFAWVDSLDDALRFLLTEEALGWASHCDDRDDVVAALRSCYEATKPNPTAAIPAVMKTYNDLLRLLSRVLWIGPVTDLLSGAGEFEEHIRQTFRQSNDESDGEPVSSPEDTLPIRPEEQSGFFELLQEYGL